MSRTLAAGPHPRVPTSHWVAPLGEGLRERFHDGASPLLSRSLSLYFYSHYLDTLRRCLFTSPTCNVQALRNSFALRRRNGA